MTDKNKIVERGECPTDHRMNLDLDPAYVVFLSDVHSARMRHPPEQRRARWFEDHNWSKP